MFRTEALVHAGDGRHGAVLLARPLAHDVLAGLFVAAAAAIVVFLGVFSVTRKAHVGGILLPAQGLIRVSAAQPGVVSSLAVKEGQAVQAGEVLLVVSGERASGAEPHVEQAIAALLQSRRDSFAGDQAALRQQAGERLAASRRRSAELAAEIARIEAQSVLQSRRVALAEATVERYAGLQAAQFVSAAQVQDKEAELIDQRQRLAELQRAKSAGERELGDLQAAAREAQAQSERDLQAGGRSIAAIEQELAESRARREIVLRAPLAGTVTAITVATGQSLAAGQAAVSLLPAGSALEAELHVPSRAAGFIRPGMAVNLRYEAYAYQKFGQATGRVREVSATAMRADELPLAAPAGEPMYRVRVALDRQGVLAYGVEQPLRSGAALQATVLLESRRLAQWIVEPLHSIAGW